MDFLAFPSKNLSSSPGKGIALYLGDRSTSIRSSRPASSIQCVKNQHGLHETLALLKKGGKDGRKVG